jgi:transcriptional regulator with XRE-family HTH domain
MVTNKDLGRTIRRLRQDQHLSIKALASKAAVPTETLGAIEEGHGNPTAGVLHDLAGALGITVGQLVLAAEAEAVRDGERRLIPKEFEQHFGHLPTDGEG